MLTPKEINKGFEEGESTETGYPMDDIWEDIALSENDTMKTVCETIMASPIWNYCPLSPDMLWMMEDLAHGPDLAQRDLRRSDKSHRDCIVVSEQKQDLHPHQCKWIQCLLQASNHGLILARTWGFSDGGYRALQYSHGSYNKLTFQC
ncbi:unnamed protein product [Camellia sinensis]